VDSFATIKTVAASAAACSNTKNSRLADYECFVYPDAAIDRDKINRDQEVKGLAPKKKAPDRIHDSSLARCRQNRGQMLINRHARPH
jgi:hypothetical protein